MPSRIRGPTHINLIIKKHTQHNIFKPHEIIRRNHSKTQQK